MKQITVFLFFLFSTAIAFAQNSKITGTVVDENNEPLIGASVVVKGSQITTMTDTNGEFSMEVSPQSTLVITYIGYVSLEVKADTQKKMLIKLSENTTNLNEVVVVGFGTQKKVNLTGAVSTVNSKMLEDRPVTNVVQALQGAAPGVIVDNTIGGGVDNAPSINIRGMGTIGQGSNGNPLVLIDGMAGDINTLNPQDIDNISILKDAAASSIYGSRAPFGVILITTKKGKTGKPVITYDGNYRATTPISLPQPVDSYTWALMFNDMQTNSGQPAYFDATWLQRIKDFRDGKLPMNTFNGKQYPMTTLPDGNGHWNSGYNAGNDNVDVFRTIFKTRNHAQEHNLSISGGTDMMNYYLSGNILDAPGMMKLGGDHQSRMGLTAKINSKLTDFLSFSYIGKFTRSKWDEPWDSAGRADWWIASQGWPILPLYDPNGFMLDSPSPYWKIVYGGRKDQETDQNTQQFNATIEPITGWKIIGEFNVTMSSILLHQGRTTFDNHDVNGNPYPDQTQSFVQEDFTGTNFYNTNVYTEYSKSVSGNNFKILAGFQSEYYKERTSSAGRNGILFPNNPTLDTTTGLDYFGNSVSPWVSGHLANWATAGYFGRINYDYKGRYLVEGNLREDGTSRFRSDMRWALLPSFSFGWNVANENFWKNLEQYVNTLKLRGSFGKLGNTNLSSYYPTYETMNLGMANGGWLVNNAKPNTAAEPNPISTGLTWEKIKVYDGGIDLAVLKNRLNASFDYYLRYTDDMVGPAPTLPAIYGINPPSTNNTSLKTKGFELELSWQDHLSNGLNYSAGFNVTDARTIITKYPNPTGAIGFYTNSAQIAYNTYYPGEEWGDIWGFTTLGIAKTQAEMDQHLATLPNGGQTAMLQGGQDSHWGAGDIMYKDLNGDGKIDFGSSTINDPGDRSIIGNITPRYIFGLNLSADWKGVDFRAFFQGVMKRDYFPIGYMFWGAGRSMWESYFLVQHLDYFRDDPNDPLGLNLNAYYPRLTTPEDWSNNFGKNHYAQTKYLQNAAYIRLKNLTLGYTIPKKITLKAHLEKVRIYLSGENIWTGTKLTKIYDPETIGNVNGIAYPLDKAYSIGLSITL